MSYILEALKKAQAERQLGNAPSIHAPAPSYTVVAAHGSRKPLVVGLAAGAIVVALGAVFLLRQPAPAPAVQAASAPAPAPLPVAEPVAVPAPPPLAATPAAPPAPVAPARPAAPVMPEKAPAPERFAAEPPAAKTEPPPRAAPAEPVSEPPRPVPVAAAPAPAAPLDEGIGPLQSLPEAVQRDVPKVAFGGYIYSPNPAERLLLVDKMLRREGEEVAPGLVLERLLPKAAIMNFRGYRYRVGY